MKVRVYNLIMFIKFSAYPQNCLDWIVNDNGDKPLIALDTFTN